MLSIDRVLETCLYVRDLDVSMRFYTNLFRFPVLFSDAKLCALNVGGSSILLLFPEGAATTPVPTGRGTIPPHDGSGPVHCAFAITADQYELWRNELVSRGIEIESEVRWPRGGKSLYFRDPDGHLIELATPGLWATY